MLDAYDKYVMFMRAEFETSVEDALFENGQPAILLTLSSSSVEVNVWLTVDEADALHRLTTLPCDSRALRLGKCANSQAHWGRDGDKTFYLLVGHDDETWDVGLTLSDSNFSAMINEVESHLRNRPR